MNEWLPEEQSHPGHVQSWTIFFRIVGKRQAEEGGIGAGFRAQAISKWLLDCPLAQIPTPVFLDRNSRDIQKLQWDCLRPPLSPRLSSDFVGQVGWFGYGRLVL